MTGKQHFTWTWRCDRCRKGGTLLFPKHLDGWSGAVAVLEAHRGRSPQCRGGVRTVRVGLKVKKRARPVTRRAPRITP
jgi:hypothetical protein